MTSEIKQSRLVTVDPAANLGRIEQQERYLTEVRGFTDRVSSAALAAYVNRVTHGRPGLR